MSEANNLEVTASDILLFLKDNMVVKEEFNEMKTEVGGLKTEVGELRSDVNELKTDVGGLKTEVKTLRTAMEAGFSSIFVELSGIKERLLVVENKIDQLFKTESEDVDAFYKDLMEIKARVERLEKRMPFQTV